MTLYGRAVPNSRITHFYLTTSDRISTFYINTVEKAYGKTCPILLVKSTLLRILNYYLIPKSILYFEYTDFSIKQPIMPIEDRLFIEDEKVSQWQPERA